MDAVRGTVRTGLDNPLKGGGSSTQFPLQGCYVGETASPFLTQHKRHDMKIQVKFSPVPQDYKQPVGLDIYLKMAKAGSPIKFVIVGAIVPGYSYWTNDKQCIRSRERPTETPNIQIEDGGKTRISHFWTLPVYDCTSESVKLLEITQRGLQDQLMEIFQGSDYDLGDLTTPMAIKISAVGEKMLTKYSLMPVPANVPDLMARLEASDLATMDVDTIVFAVPAAEATPKGDSPTPTPTMAVASATDRM
jgi:hypothetical protein